MTTPATRSPTPRRLARRTTAAYTADWQLFEDWCSAAGLTPLPAEPTTLLKFLVECPASDSTLRRRITAIDHHHTAAGATPPGTDRAVQQALGKPTKPEAADVATYLEMRLRDLPSHGWTAGLFGRRDRVLLVLTATGATPADLGAATAGDLGIDAGTATFHAPDHSNTSITLAGHPDPEVCGPCACTRWVRLLNLIAESTSHRRWRDAISAAAPVTHTSPHQCGTRTAATVAAAGLPLLPRIDQWGYLDLTPQPVGPRSLHRLATRMLSEQPPPSRRHLSPGPLDPDNEPPPPAADPAPQPVSAPFGAAELAAGWERRRWQNDRANEIDSLLYDLETRVAAALSQSSAPSID